ncbi:MAG: FtsX-like permease family protein [Thermoproteota archaeon]
MNCRMRYTLLKAFFLFLVFLFILYSFEPVYSQDDADIKKLQEAMKLINITKIQEHVRFFSSLNSRVIGTSGFYKAAEYIKNEFSKYGLKEGPDGFFHVYNHTATIENSAELLVEPLNVRIKLLTIWPNLILTSKTPPDGIEGELTYIGGTGDLKDFDGKEVRDRIVVMNYETGSNWLNAAKLGAKAVIFIPSNNSVTDDPLSKFITAPLYFPRYYAAQNASLVKELALKESRVIILSNMSWEIVRGINVVGVIEGSDPVLKDQIIIVSSHFDSWSPVPELAPGADESCGISSLLEIARVLAKQAKEGNPPKRTIWFVALSGNWQQLDGARNFVMDYIFNGRSEQDWPYTTPSQYKVYAWIGIDLSTGSSKLGFLFFSYFYRPLNLLGLYSGRTSALIQLFKINQKQNLRVIINAMKDISSKYSQYENNVLFGDDDAPKTTPTGLLFSGGDLWGGLSYVPRRDYLESEPAMIAGTPALTLRTVYDYRVVWWTTRDTIEKVNFANLEPQVLFSFGVVWVVSNVENLGIDYESQAKPTELKVTPGTYTGPGMSAVRGNLQTYDIFTDRFADYCPNGTALVIVTSQSYDPRSYIITATDKRGRFLVKGLGSPSLYYGYGGMIGPSYQFSAFVVNSTTGEVDMAPMSGTHTSGLFVTGGSAFIGVPAVYRAGEFLKLPVYKPATIVIFDAFSPYTLSSQYVDPITGDPWDPMKDAVSAIITAPVQFYPPLDSVTPPINVITGAEHDSYSGWENPYTNVWVEYVTPEISTGLILKSAQVGLRLGLIVNSSKVNLAGSGLVLKEGQELRVSAVQICFDLFNVNEERIRKLESFGILDRSILQLHKNDENLLNKAKELLVNKQYSKAYPLIYTIWMSEVRVYDHLLSTIYDTTSVMVFFAAILLPFAYVLEESVYGGEEGTKTVAIVAAIFCLTYFLFGVLHPGFTIASSAITVALGFVVIVLSIPIFTIFLGEVSVAVKELRRKMLGAHEEEVSRISQTSTAFTIGIRNLKKRTLRTTLTAISLIVFVASLTSLTSLTTLRITQYTTLPGPLIGGKNVEPIALYDGIQIKQIGLSPISPNLIEAIQTILGHNASVDFEVWYYPNFFTTLSEERTFELINSQGNTYTFNALLGLTPKLIKLYNMTAFFNGTIFDLSQYSGIPDVIPVVLPKSACEKLGYKLNDKFAAIGLNFVITGIFDDRNLNKEHGLVDLDQDIPTPVDLSMIKLGAQQLAALESPSRLKKLDWSKIMILPADVALSLGGKIRQVSFTFPNRLDFEEVISTKMETSVTRLIDMYNLEVVIGEKGKGVKLMSRRNQVIVSGLNLLVIPLAIVILAIFNTFLANVYERTKEIKTFSAVGLSPTGVAGMFIAEALTFGLVSAIAGYVLGIGLIKFLPESFTPNYSTAVIVIVIGLSIVAIIIASFYPALMASRLVTPSLERKWRIPTKPIGGLWEIPMPFTAEKVEEALAVLYFVKEYLDANALERSGTMFATESSGLLKTDEGEWILRSAVRLAPFESGLSQISDLRITRDKEGKIVFSLKLEHKSGPLAQWIVSAREFVGIIRKQLLLWRGLVPSEKMKYTEQALRKVSGT